MVNTLILALLLGGPVARSGVSSLECYADRFGSLRIMKNGREAFRCGPDTWIRKGNEVYELSIENQVLQLTEFDLATETQRKHSVQHSLSLSQPRYYDGTALSVAKFDVDSGSQRCAFFVRDDSGAAIYAFMFNKPSTVSQIARMQQDVDFVALTGSSIYWSEFGLHLMQFSFGTRETHEILRVGMSTTMNQVIVIDDSLSLVVCDTTIEVLNVNSLARTALQSEPEGVCMVAMNGVFNGRYYSYVQGNAGLLNSRTYVMSVPLNGGRIDTAFYIPGKVISAGIDRSGIMNVYSVELAKQENCADYYFLSKYDVRNSRFISVVSKRERFAWYRIW